MFSIKTPFFTLLFIALLAIVLLGCGGVSRTTAGVAPNTQWVLSTMNGQPIMSGVAITAEFDQSVMFGSSGCNNYHIPYTTKRNQVTFGQGVAETAKACDPSVMDLEQTYLATLPTGKRYETVGTTLQLLNATGYPILVYVKMETSLPGTAWNVLTYNNGKGAVQSVAAGTTMTANFGIDSNLTGNAGCNDYTARYSVRGNSIRIDPPSSNKKACDQAVMDQETAYLAALPQAEVYRFDNGQLVLTTSGGKALATFVAPPPPVIAQPIATPPAVAEATAVPPTAVPPTAVPPTQGPSCAGAPTIEYFTANPTTITQGQTTSLQWGVVGNATGVGIEPGIGGVAAPGSTQLQPAQTTTYVMTATGCGGQVQKSVTVVVNPAAPVCPGPPTIEYFTANPATITQGQSTTLQWGMVSNATSVGIDQGIGGVGTPGSRAVSPGGTTTYTMVATGCGGQSQKSVTVTVNPKPQPTAVPPTPVPPTAVPPTKVPPTATPKPPSITGIKWLWMSASNPTVTVPNPQAYWIAFNPDGSMSGKADCNSFNGTYSQSNGFHINITTTTGAICGPDSLDQQYLGFLRSVVAGGPANGGLALEGPGGAPRMLFSNGGPAQ